jgi:hypothetical protein
MCTDCAYVRKQQLHRLRDQMPVRITDLQYLKAHLPSPYKNISKNGEI